MQDLDGQHLFSRDTEKIAIKQTGKAQHIQDVEGFDPYHVLPPLSNSNHSLTEKLSRRPESRLEHFHGHVAHYGNSGMNRTLADCLSL